MTCLSSYWMKSYEITKFLTPI